MARSNPPEKILELEHTILRVLSGGRVTPAVRDDVARELANHEWRAPEHRVVYEALGRIGYHDPETIREQLPAQATRMGFPEVDWKAYFEPGRERPEDLAELVRELGTVRAEGP